MSELSDPSLLASAPVESPASPPAPRFSPFVTALAAVVLLAGLMMFFWLQISVPRLDRVQLPDRALELMIGRTMDVEEALTRVPAWERFLHNLTMGDGEDELPLAVDWYEELAAYSNEPLGQLQLGVLYGEAGRLEQVRRLVKSWERRPAPYPLYAELLESAYLESRVSPTVQPALQTHLDELLRAGWFHDRIAARLAAHAGDRKRLAAINETQAARSGMLLTRVRWLAGVQLGGILAGAVALWLVVRRGTDSFKVGRAPVPPPWRGRIGAIVLIRGGALGVVVMFVLLSIGANDRLVEAVSVPAINLPLLVLARRHLFEPAGLKPAEAFGLRLTRGAGSRLAVVVAGLLAASFVMEWVMSEIAQRAELSSHWTEWFDGDLVWGNLPDVAVSLTEYVLLAPVFEEIVFRGLLYATLRRRLGWGMSAVASASLFAVAHGYGVLGFTSVLWSGIVWAWAYEKSGSLLPGIVAHAINNLFVCFTVMYMLRG
jgi:membrane protease YdiL (CAAX protease family)